MEGYSTITLTILVMAQSASPTEIVAAVERATRDFKLCPNRIWELAGSPPQGEQNLPLQGFTGRFWQPLYHPPKRLINSRQITKALDRQYDQHDQCTFDFCEYSRRDFTSVAQRHLAPQIIHVSVSGVCFQQLNWKQLPMLRPRQCGSWTDSL